MNKNEYDCDYYMIRLELPDGPVLVDFDFTPQKPTNAQLWKYIQRSCDTCLFNAKYEAEGIDCGQESYPNAPCSQWHLHFDALIDAEHQYWLDLHRKTMKGKPIPIGRTVSEWDNTPYISYPDE